MSVSSLRSSDIQLGLGALGIIDLVEFPISKRPIRVGSLDKVASEVCGSASADVAIGIKSVSVSRNSRRREYLRIVGDREGGPVKPEAGHSSITDKGFVSIEEDIGWLASAGY
jgi:hypothetical protein